MKKDNDLDINQILRYLNNEMSERELIKFKKLLNDDENLNEFKKYIITDHYIQLGKNDFDNQKALSLFQKHIQSTKSHSKTRKNRINNYLKYAAVFVGLIIGTTIYLNKDIFNTDDIVNEVTLQLSDGSFETIQSTELFKEIKSDDGTVVGVQEKSKIVYNNEKENVAEVSTKINTLKVPYGKKFQLVLSDGTTVHVNAGSTLKFPVQFAVGQVREVELSGEAYFEVARNEKAPFIVSTNGIKTEVLGTKFNVSSYDDDSFSEVVLVEGSVGVFKDEQRFNKDTDQILKPNQKASLIISDQNMSISTVKTENYIAWVDGILLFRNESFESIAKKLERSYDKKITINYQKIKEEKFTGQFDVESIEDVLKTFKSNTSFNFTIKENEIIINP
ncbi:FecR family protein [Aquimarina sp. MAR_2010_214]|uniref:FecR family protein n=1 Tax=Aquimarina sp. MAR_2010_214 TaxID=1250026 RepID=UPI000C70C217|nr:FecR domain-containing protein [Aquimarina sp. MAR_2010_214]PKV50468.1 FecR family protein [Aquimarina sp. MAR_2010_214]